MEWFLVRACMEDCRLYGMKSHDCHIFMQTLIPLAYPDLLPKGI